LTETITIIGGGLTGLSLAIALRNHGVPVILHEAGSYPRHRVCGEFISGISPDTLENLGISEALSDVLLHCSVSWFSGNSHLRHTALSEPALAISRHLLDDRLQRMAVRSGVILRTGSRMKPEPGAAGIVWAAGRRPTKGNWIGLKAHIRNIVTTAELEMHSGPAGYLGITPIEDGWNNACGLFKLDSSTKAKQAALLPAYLDRNGNTHLAQRIRDAEWKEDSFTAVAGFGLGLQEPMPGVLALGDSHAIIPPFTGNGMTMAFQSAEIALPHLIAFASGESPWHAACNAIQNELLQTFKIRLASAKLIHPILFHPAARPILKYAPLDPILSLVR
jgi:menaquinone-9 beta-reductase